MVLLRLLVGGLDGALDDTISFVAKTLWLTLTLNHSGRVSEVFETWILTIVVAPRQRAKSLKLICT